MGIDNIWVFAQAADGAPTTGTLELLTRARSLGGTVAAFIAGDGAGEAAALGDHGAAKVYATGDLAGALPGVAVAAAMQAVIDGGDSPDLIMFPQSYEGRDVMSRLSVKLDRTVLTNSTSVTVDGDSVTVQTPIFGGGEGDDFAAGPCVGDLERFGAGTCVGDRGCVLVDLAFALSARVCPGRIGEQLDAVVACWYVEVEVMLI